MSSREFWDFYIFSSMMLNAAQVCSISRGAQKTIRNHPQVFGLWNSLLQWESVAWCVCWMFCALQPKLVSPHTNAWEEQKWENYNQPTWTISSFIHIFRVFHKLLPATFPPKHITSSSSIHKPHQFHRLDLEFIADAERQQQSRIELSCFNHRWESSCCSSSPLVDGFECALCANVWME